MTPQPSPHHGGTIPDRPHPYRPARLDDRTAANRLLANRILRLSQVRTAPGCASIRPDVPVGAADAPLEGGRR
jgi:hypothetical protein